jgi:hypothetical protein
MNKKVFVSHASEDKDRFVMDFSNKLMANGVDTWLDKWEMSPGDSLVDKIFEEGIKEADIFIVVLSKYSVNKPWVKEELNAGFVKRVGNNCKIIPIVLDDCIVPECLSSTIWEKINNLSSYDENFQRILNSIFGLSDKPSIGQVPVRAKLKINEIYGLNKIDTIVFTEACNFIIKKDENSINISEIYENFKKYNISDEDIQDSLEILDSKSYIKTHARTIGKFPISFFNISVYGFEEFANSNIDNYAEIVDIISLKIINESLSSNLEIKKVTVYPMLLINHTLELLSSRSFIDIVECIGGEIFIRNISPEFKRQFRD